MAGKRGAPDGGCGDAADDAVKRARGVEQVHRSGDLGAGYAAAAAASGSGGGGAVDDASLDDPETALEKLGDGENIHKDVLETSGIDLASEEQAPPPALT